MKKGLIIAMVLFLPAGCSRRDPAEPAGTDGWLRGDAGAKFITVAKHLRGNDVVMMEAAHRHRELQAAIGARNWPYAEYQLEKMELTMQLGAERRPARRPSYDQFFRTALPAMKAALATGDPARANAAYQTLTQDCIHCHEQERVAFIPVQLPPK